MNDEELIGYLFDLLDPTDRAAAEARAAADPEIAARIEFLRASAGPMLAAMDAERAEPPEPRPGLAVRTIAKVAAHVAEHEPREPEPVVSEIEVAAMIRDSNAEIEIEFDSGTRAKVPQAAIATPRPAPPSADGPELRGGPRLRADLLVAACIAFVGFGLIVSGIAKARHTNRVVACQENLQTLSAGLSRYADTDPQGRYPQVGTTDYPTADTFTTPLVGQFLPLDFKPGCPAGTNCPTYTFALGYNGPNGQVVGLRRPDANSNPADENDLMPVAADLPAASAAPTGGPCSPHATCMNVLFIGGNVRLTKSPNVGPRGDDIYRNVYGNVAAGADRNDAVLGGVGAKP